MIVIGFLMRVLAHYPKYAGEVVGGDRMYRKPFFFFLSGTLVLSPCVILNIATDCLLTLLENWALIAPRLKVGKLPLSQEINKVKIFFLHFSKGISTRKTNLWAKYLLEIRKYLT